MKLKVLAFGEVLWDKFGNTREIGGAPFNFCAHLAKLGINSYSLTAIGDDDLGEETLKIIDSLGVKTDFVRTVPYPTGTCIVTTDENGRPGYDLTQPAAWDYIEPYTELVNRSAAGEFNLFYFGTLALRSDTSFETLKCLVNTGSFEHIFCDLNLRQSFYSDEIIDFALKTASILKINREEPRHLINNGFADADNNDTERAQKYACRSLSEKYAIKLILLTLDKDGALIYDSGKDKFHSPSKPKSKAVSGVGAGDSFSACFIANFLSGVPTEECAERAILLSDYVVTKYGAVPDYPPELIRLITP